MENKEKPILIFVELIQFDNIKFVLLVIREIL